MKENSQHFSANALKCSLQLNADYPHEDVQNCLDSLPSQDPPALLVLITQGSLYGKIGEYEKATTRFEEAKNLYPKNTQAQSLYYTMLLIEDTSNTAHLDKLKELYSTSNDSRILQNIIVFLNEREEFEEARKLLDYALEIEPNNWNFLTSNGVWYAKQNELKTAEKYFLQAYNNGGAKEITLLNNLGLLYRELGDQSNDIENYKKSVDYYDQVLKLDPDNEYAINGVTIANENFGYSFLKIYEIINWQLAILIIVIFSITFYFLYRTFRDIQKHPNKKVWKLFPKYNMHVQMIIVIVMCLVTIPISLHLLSLYYKIEIKDGDDITNWATMVSEIIVGVMIAVVILVYELTKQSKFAEQQDEIKTVVGNIKTIENQQIQTSKELLNLMAKENERISNWKTRWGNGLIHNLLSIRQLYFALEKWLTDYSKNPTPIDKSNIIETSKKNAKIVDFYASNIKRDLPNIERYFDDPVLNLNLKSLCNTYSTILYSMEQDYHWTVDGISNALESIKQKVDVINRDIERLAKEIPDKKDLEEIIDDFK